MLSNTISFVRDYLFTMPVLAKFAVGMVMLVIIPRLSRRSHVYTLAIRGLVEGLRCARP